MQNLLFFLWGNLWGNFKWLIWEKSWGRDAGQTKKNSFSEFLLTPLSSSYKKNQKKKQNQQYFLASFFILSSQNFSLLFRFSISNVWLLSLLMRFAPFSLVLITFLNFTEKTPVVSLDSTTNKKKGKNCRQWRPKHTKRK